MNKFFTQKNNSLGSYEAKGFRSGFTLVETLVAISIFTVALLAMMSVLSSGISNTTYTKQKMLAAYLAQEGIEYIRNMRDNHMLYPTNGGWNAFTNKLSSCRLNNNGCGIDNRFPTTNNNFIFQCSNPPRCNLYIDNNENYNADPSGIDSGFIRTIRMDSTGLGTGEVKIFSKVEWIQGSGTYSITFSENLFNWVE